MQAIRDRHDLKAATLEEFEAEYRAGAAADGEG